MRNYLTRRNDDFGFGFFDDVWDNFFAPVQFTKKNRYMSTDIKETETGYELMIDMPGFEKNDIQLSLDNGYLKVEAKREEKEENENFVRRERNFSCSRTFYVGDAVTEDDIKAKYNNGTLSLEVPKKERELPQKKNIAIE